MRQGRGSDVTGVLGAKGKCSLCSGIRAVAVPSMAWPLFPPSLHRRGGRERKQCCRQPADSLLPSSGISGIVRSNGFSMTRKGIVASPSSLSPFLHSQSNFTCSSWLDGGASDFSFSPFAFLCRCTPPHLVMSMPETMEDTPAGSQEPSTPAPSICKVRFNTTSS